jgi:hypothetical protein
VNAIAESKRVATAIVAAAADEEDTVELRVTSAPNQPPTLMSGRDFDRLGGNRYKARRTVDGLIQVDTSQVIDKSALVLTQSIMDSRDANVSTTSGASGVGVGGGSSSSIGDNTSVASGHPNVSKTPSIHSLSVGACRRAAAKAKALRNKPKLEPAYWVTPPVVTVGRIDELDISTLEDMQQTLVPKPTTGAFSNSNANTSGIEGFDFATGSWIPGTDNESGPISNTGSSIPGSNKGKSKTKTAPSSSNHTHKKRALTPNEQRKTNALTRLSVTAPGGGLHANLTGTIDLQLGLGLGLESGTGTGLYNTGNVSGTSESNPNSTIPYAVDPTPRDRQTLLPAGNFEFTPSSGTRLGAGDHIITALFVPEDKMNYVPVESTVSFTVSPQVGEVVWSLPPPIVVGHALRAVHLDASITYTPCFTNPNPNPNPDGNSNTREIKRVTKSGLKLLAAEQSTQESPTSDEIMDTSCGNGSTEEQSDKEDIYYTVSFSPVLGEIMHEVGETRLFVRFTPTKKYKNDFEEVLHYVPITVRGKPYDPSKLDRLSANPSPNPNPNPN